MANYGSTKEFRDDPGYSPYKDSRQDGRFTDMCSEISGNISLINNGANTLDRAMKILNTERDSPQIRDRIHETSQTTNKIVTKTTKLVKEVASLRGLDRAQKLQVDRLKSDFHDSIERFSTLQKRAAEKVKQTTKLVEKKPQSGGWLDEDDDKSPFLEQEKKREEMQAQEQVIEDDLMLIRDREERIRQLEGDILDVNEIFRDLGAMISEQGEVIDSIEANVERAYTNVEQGAQQLGKASEYQRKSRKKMCCLLIILLIIVAIITIIIVVSLKK